MRAQASSSPLGLAKHLNRGLKINACALMRNALRWRVLPPKSAIADQWEFVACEELPRNGRTPSPFFSKSMRPPFSSAFAQPYPIGRGEKTVGRISNCTARVGAELPFLGSKPRPSAAGRFPLRRSCAATMTMRPPRMHHWTIRAIRRRAGSNLHGKNFRRSSVRIWVAFRFAVSGGNCEFVHASLNAPADWHLVGEGTHGTGPGAIPAVRDRKSG